MVLRLLCVEHVEKNDKPMLYLVFEYMDTDLKKYIDLHGRGPSGSPLQSKVIQVLDLPLPVLHSTLNHLTSFDILIESPASPT